MKPSKFDFLRPVNLKEALELLEEHGEDAKIISGGQSLIPIMNMRLSTPEYLIDLAGVEGLSYIFEEEDELAIGTMTKQVEVERSALVQKRCPILIDAIKYIGHAEIRHRGTVGGSIAHADPSAELPCVLAALRGKIIVVSKDDEQVVTPEEFFLTYLLTTLEPTDMIKEIRFPCLPATSGYSFQEISRTQGDFALVAVAAVIDLNDEGFISFARLAIAGVASVPSALEDVEEFLINKEPTNELFQEASELVREYTETEDDIHASAEYREEMAVVMTGRALESAVNRVKGVGSIE